MVGDLNLRNPLVRAWLKQRRLVYFYLLLVIGSAAVISLSAFFSNLEPSIKLLRSPFSILAFPVVFALLFLLKERPGRGPARNPSGLHVMIRQQLLAARDWDHFVDTLLQFPQGVIPLAGASLTICDPIAGSCEAVKEWSPTGSQLPKYLNLFEDSSLTFIVQSQPLGFFIPPDQSRSDGEAPSLTCFCLPFLFASRHIGFLLLYLPQGTQLTADQINTLNELIPELCFLLEFAYLKRSFFQYNEILEKEQRRIARYLHDTVAQNLAVLRYRLDRLVSQDTYLTLPNLLSQLEQIHAIAGQADNELRDSIADLRREPTVELDSAFLEFAQEAGQLAGFTLDISSKGEAQKLPAHLQRQVFLILREAIRNIEKHAQASRVTIHSEWQKECLKLMIEDNGRGFDQEEAVRLKGHYGLKLMQEGAKELNAQLTFHSSPGSGARITLEIPLAAPLYHFADKYAGSSARL